MSAEIESPLAKWRQYLALTQRELAHAVGCSAGHISDVEHGLAHLGENLEKYLQTIADHALEVINNQEAFMESTKNRLQSTLPDKDSE